MWPSYITNDKELDLFLYQHNQNLTWISNIRGASAELNLNNVTSKLSAGSLISDFDKDFKEDILQITVDRKTISFNKKQISFRKVTWQ